MTIWLQVTLPSSIMRKSPSFLKAKVASSVVKNARLRYYIYHNYQHPTLGCRHFLRGAPCYLRARKSEPEPEPEVRDHLAHPGTIGAWPGLVTSLRASWDASLCCQHKGSTGRPSPMTEQNFNKMLHKSRNLCDWKLT